MARKRPRGAYPQLTTRDLYEYIVGLTPSAALVIYGPANTPVPHADPLGLVADVFESHEGLVMMRLAVPRVLASGRWYWAPDRDGRIVASPARSPLMPQWDGLDVETWPRHVSIYEIHTCVGDAVRYAPGAAGLEVRATRDLVWVRRHGAQPSVRAELDLDADASGDACASAESDAEELSDAVGYSSFAETSDE